MKQRASARNVQIHLQRDFRIARTIEAGAETGDKVGRSAQRAATDRWKQALSPLESMPG